MLDLSFSKVSLLLHGEGANGSTVFTDSSPRPKAVSQVGGASISTAVAAFGTASIRNLAASYVLAPAHADFDFGTGDFCIEMKVLFASSVTGQDIYFFDRNGTGNGMRLELFGGVLNFYTNSTFVLNNIAWAPATNTQYHLALARVAGVVRLFVDGVLKGSANYTAAVNIDGPGIRFGNYGAVGNFGLNGYLDEVRVTKGDGRYAAAFSPPTAAFPDAGPLFYDTFTAANGTTLAAHVSDNGLAWTDPPAGYESYLPVSSGGAYLGAATLKISGNRLEATGDPGFGDGSAAGAAKVAQPLPMDNLTITINVIAGAADQSTYQNVAIDWPLGDWSTRRNQVACDAAGYVSFTQTDPVSGGSGYPAQLAWVLGSAHTIEYVIGGGLITIKDNGAVVGTWPWSVLADTPNAFVLESYGSGPTMALFDSLQIDGTTSTGPAARTANATGLASTTVFGTPTNRRTQSATGKPSSLAFGVATNRRAQPATGKTSGLVFGLPASSITAASHVASGIPSGTTFGAAKTGLTQQVASLPAHAVLGTPTASVVGGTLSGFVETFTGAANEALGAHVSDTGQTWNDGGALYGLDSTGTRLLPCFQVTLTATAGVIGYAVPANAKAILKLQPPTSGTNPFQLIFGSGNAAASTPSFNGAAGLVYSSGGNVQVRWYLSSSTSVLIGQLTKAQLGSGLTTFIVENGKITVNEFVFVDSQITGLVEGAGLVLDLYSNTSTSTARPYLESIAVDVAPASNRTQGATGKDSGLTFGLPQAIPGQDVVATGIASTLSFGAPTGGYSTNTFAHPTGMPSAVTFGVPASRRTVVAAGFSSSVFGTPTTPTPQTANPVWGMYATVGYPTAKLTKHVNHNRVLRAGTMRRTRIGYPKAK